MIVRKRNDSFVMIEQNDHATVAGQLYEHTSLNTSLLAERDRLAVQDAIHLHDIGWKPFDVAAIWNDEKKAPYDFITYPTSIKTVLYRQGIDIVAETNDYAALLCSEHYVRFLEKDMSSFAKQFVRSERARQQKLIHNCKNFNQASFITHYELLHFFDTLSLYICLHEPNRTNKDIHYFFTKGIQLPKLYGSGRLQLAWEECTLKLEHKLLHRPQTIELKQRVVSKEHVKQNGLIHAWEETEVEVVPITVV